MIWVCLASIYREACSLTHSLLRMPVDNIMYVFWEGIFFFDFFFSRPSEFKSNRSEYIQQYMNGKQDALHTHNTHLCVYIYTYKYTDAHTTHSVIHYVCILLPHHSIHQYWKISNDGAHTIKFDLHLRCLLFIK